MGSASVEGEASDCLRFLPADDAARNIVGKRRAGGAMGSPGGDNYVRASRYDPLCAIAPLVDYHPGLRVRLRRFDIMFERKFPFRQGDY